MNQASFRICISTGLTIASGGVAAQDTGLCGSYPQQLYQGNIEHSETTGSTRPLTASIARGEPAYFELTTQSSSKAVFETHVATELDDKIDPILILIDQNGNVITRNDDGGNGSNAKLVTRLPVGRYCLQVSTFPKFEIGEAAPGGFSAEIPFSATVEHITSVEGQDTLVLSNNTQVGSAALQFDGSIVLTGPKSEEFSFRLAEPSALTLTAQSSNFDTVMRVYDRFGGLVAEDDDGGVGTNSHISIETNLPAEIYTAKVESLNEAPGDFVVTIQTGVHGHVADSVDVTEVVPTSDENTVSTYDGCRLLSASAGTFGDDPAVSPRAVQLTASVQDDSEFYAFRVAEPMNMRLMASSTDLDSQLSLHRLKSDDAEEIAYNDDALGKGFDSLIETELSPGDYCAEVSGRNRGGTGEIVLSIAEYTEEMRLRDGYRSGEIVPPLDGGLITDLGVLETSVIRTDFVSERTKWYRFSVDQESLIWVTGGYLGNSTRIRIFNLEQLARNIDALAGRTDEKSLYTNNFHIVDKGEYAIAVTAMEAIRPSSVQLSLQRYIAASQ